MTRLTLDMTGIKSPLDVSDRHHTDDDTPDHHLTAPPPPEPDTPLDSDSHAPRRRRRSTRPQSGPEAVAQHDPSPPFYGSGRPIQTSIALDAELAGQIEDLARAAAVSVNALLVATLHAGLPTTTDDARHAAIIERAEISRAPRIETNVRLPAQLRARLDQLTANVRDATKRATRADLANAVLRSAIPADAERAARLVNEHHRRLELLALAA
jgi:hypothetical protein